MISEYNPVYWDFMYPRKKWRRRWHRYQEKYRLDHTKVVGNITPFGTWLFITDAKYIWPPGLDLRKHFNGNYATNRYFARKKTRVLRGEQDE